MSPAADLQVSELATKFDEFLISDKAWKEDFSKKLEPILAERMDREILKRYGLSGAKILAGFVGFVVSIGMLFKYVVSPLMGWK